MLLKVTSEAGRSGVEHILNTSHTLGPDLFQTNPPKQVTIEEVSSHRKMSIADGNRSIDVYPVNNTHSNDMLAVFLPSERILLTSDLYSPGSTPEQFRKYSKQLLDFITDNKIDVETIAGTHGGFGSVKDLYDFVNQKDI